MRFIPQECYIYHIPNIRLMQDHKLAVLIDADNVPYANVKEMLEEI